MLGGLHNFVELDDVGMADKFENVDLSVDPFNIGNVDYFFFFEDLDGDFFAGGSVSCKFDFAECALSQCFFCVRGIPYR